MKLEGTFEVVDVRPTQYRGIMLVELRGESELDVVMEYPSGVVNVPLDKGSMVRLGIDNVKDERFRENWDVYMWGLVYYVGGNRVKISVGGLIIDVRNYRGAAMPGEKVYVGLKVLRRQY